MKRDPDEEVAPPPDGRREPAALAPDDEGEGTAQVRLAVGERRLGVGRHDPETPDVEVGEGSRQVVDGSDQEVLGRSGRGLDGGRGEGRLAPARDDDTVDAGRLEMSRIVESLTALMISLNARYKTHAGVRITGLPDDLWPAP